MRMEGLFFLSAAPGFTEILDIVIKYGAVPVCFYWIWTLRQDVAALRIEIVKLQEEHKSDLRKNADELKTLIQNLQR